MLKVGDSVRYCNKWMRQVGIGPTSETASRVGLVVGHEHRWVLVDWGSEIGVKPSSPLSLLKFGAKARATHTGILAPPEGYSFGPRCDLGDPMGRLRKRVIKLGGAPNVQVGDEFYAYNTISGEVGWYVLVSERQDAVNHNDLRDFSYEFVWHQWDYNLNEWVPE